MRSRRWLVVGLLALVACREASPPAAHVAPQNADSTPGSKSPVSQTELPTTDGSIAMDNLSGEVETLERLLADGKLDARRMPGLVQTLLTRGQYQSRIADYERAEELAERCVRNWPGEPGSYLARASARATFHRFDTALVDLAQAERLGARKDRVEALRESIAQARGRYDEALAVRSRAAAANLGVLTRGALATVHAEKGDIDEAERLFHEAVRSYKDVSPFPVAWVWFQQGHMWMDEGKYERARELLVAAHQRLPGYAPAQGHLGEVEAMLGNRAAALDHLRPLALHADDPYYAAQLARILAARGTSTGARERAEAAHRRDIAVQRYEELLAKHPEAFADHGAEFYLGAGGDAKRALDLARKNLDLRVTPRSVGLALLAALVAADGVAACDYADRAVGLGHVAPPVRLLVDHAHAVCGRAAKG
jgi:tetratricopeptide (TPR) repeat protein